LLGLTANESQTAKTKRLLRDWANGDRAALNQLIPRLYRELRRIAGHLMQDERRGGTIQTTALVHEAYLKLVDIDNVSWQHRAQFLAIAAQAMRHILLDRARRRGAAKRGGNLPPIKLDEVPDPESERAAELVAIDRALETLAKFDPRKAKVVEMRFFGGLTTEESASVLGVSSDTILRDWKFARAWLLAELDPRH
jgi:RNA polymerase sigma factor (TIGR02999 family)